ncbi:MAG: 16S rRNA (guanine(527)-N(7))-methyltransferase RsmG [bacterium]
MKHRYDHEIERELKNLRNGLTVLGLDYNDSILQKFRVYLDVLFTERNKLHLLSHQDYKRIAKRHFLTSLMALDQVKKHSRVCDIGAGAGFPSMPLKIMKPQMKLTMIESQRKKAEFLRHLIKELAYHDVDIVNQRVEDYFDEVFEVILLRAVGKIKGMLSTIERLLEPGGRAVFYKTIRVEEEIDDDLLKDFHIDIKKVLTPLEHTPLALVILQKKQ